MVGPHPFDAEINCSPGHDLCSMWYDTLIIFDPFGPIWQGRRSSSLKKTVSTESNLYFFHFLPFIRQEVRRIFEAKDQLPIPHPSV